MDPAPKAIQPFILITTALVVIGAGAIALLWMLVFEDGKSGLALPSGPAEAEVRRVDFPDGVPAAERERLRALGGRLLDPAEAARRAETANELVAAGRDALPVLLTAMRDVVSDEKALADASGQARFGTIDDVLVRIRATLTPSEPAGAPPDLTDVASLRRRARLWFGWYARVERAE
jgi:hypothetical protein